MFGPSIVEKPKFEEYNDVRSARETVKIAGTRITGDAYIWMDLMPGMRTDKLLAKFRLKAKHEDAHLPDRIDAVTFFVVNEDNVWKPSFDVKIKGERVREKVFVHRQGPTWDPEIKINLYARIEDDRGNRYYLNLGKHGIRKVY